MSSLDGVRFESERAYVLVYYDAESFEIGLEIGPLNGVGERYPMSAIMRLVDPDKAGEYRDYAADTRMGVAHGVCLLAVQFRGYVEAGLLDDPKVFERLREVSESWKRQYAKDVRLTKVRNELDSAWREKNYRKVVELLEPILSDLTPSERKKLELSRKSVADAKAHLDDHGARKQP